MITVLYCTDIASGTPKKPYARFTAVWKSTLRASSDCENNKSFIQSIKDIVFGESHLRLVQPMGLIQLENGDLIVIDRSLGALLRINPPKGIFEYLIQPDSRSYPSLVSLCKGPGTTILFTDSVLNQVFHYDLQTGQVILLNDTLVQPTGIAWSSETGRIWVSETGKHCLAVMDRNGDIIRKIGGRGKDPGKFNFPNFLHIGPDHLVYVIDAMNFRIQVFDQLGTVHSHFGEPGNTSGYMLRPKGICVDRSGNIFVADGLLNTIQVFDKEGNYLYRFGQAGEQPGAFLLPAGIYMPSDDSIYIADSYNGRIQKFDLIKIYED